MKILGAQIDQKFFIAAMIGAIVGSLVVRLIHRWIVSDETLDKHVGPN